MKITAIIGQFPVAQFDLIEGAPFFSTQGGGTKLVVVAQPNSALKFFSTAAVVSSTPF